MSLSYEESDMSGSSTDDILIVGGGLAGLALTGYLARQGREPTVVEQADQWRASGYGIGLWEEGIAVLDELGCLEAARRHAADPSRFEIRATGGEVLTQTTVPADQTLLLAIYRADLHAALREGVPTDWIRMGTAPTDVEERVDGVICEPKERKPVHTRLEWRTDVIRGTVSVFTFQSTLTDCEAPPKAAVGRNFNP